MNACMQRSLPHAMPATHCTLECMHALRNVYHQRECKLVNNCGRFMPRTSSGERLSFQTLSGVFLSSLALLLAVESAMQTTRELVKERWAGAARRLGTVRFCSRRMEVRVCMQTLMVGRRSQASTSYVLRTETDLAHSLNILHLCCMYAAG